MKKAKQPYGYFLLTVESSTPNVCLKSNSERAFIIAQLQSLLSPRLILNEIPAHKQLATCIDLLAFSLRKERIELVLFSIDTSICRYIGNVLCAKLTEYTNEHTPALHPRRFHMRITKLRGPHHALATTCTLHSLHPDWEYDRYSSIGFYLHDRRGDWMRVWRMAQLYEGDPSIYRALLKQPFTPPLYS